MVFKSRKDAFFILVYLNTSALLIIYFIYKIISSINSSSFGIVNLLIVLLVVTYLLFTLNTKYKLSKTKLHYKSGFIRGEIEINTITEITKGKTLWLGTKPATALKGLIIKYNKYDELYISPKTNDSFIAEILKFNSDIKITTA